MNGSETPDIPSSSAPTVTAETTTDSSDLKDPLSLQPASTNPLQTEETNRSFQSPVPEIGSEQPASLSSPPLADDDDDGSSNLSSLVSPGMSNLPPVPSNMYNISSIGDIDDSSADLFESCIEDGAAGQPFMGAVIPDPQQVLHIQMLS